MLKSKHLIKTDGINVNRLAKVKTETKYFDNETTLEFNISNSHIHVFYSATYGGTDLLTTIIPQYNTLIIKTDKNDGFSVSDLHSGQNLKIGITRASWNTYNCPITHLTF